MRLATFTSCRLLHCSHHHTQSLIQNRRGENAHTSSPIALDPTLGLIISMSPSSHAALIPLLALRTLSPKLPLNTIWHFFTLTQHSSLDLPPSTLTMHHLHQRWEVEEGVSLCVSVILLLLFYLSFYSLAPYDFIQYIVHMYFNVVLSLE